MPWFFFPPVKMIMHIYMGNLYHDSRQENVTADFAVPFSMPGDYSGSEIHKWKTTLLWH